MSLFHGWLWALAAAGVALSASALGENLVPNAGFEQIGRDGKIPDGWQFTWKNTHSGDAARGDQKQPPDFAVDKQCVHSGLRSVRIGTRRAEDDGVLTAATIPADPAVKIYRASVWMKTENMHGAAARLCAVSLGEDGKWLGADYDLIVVAEDHQWGRYVGLFVSAKGTRQIRLRLWLNFRNQGTGTAWFDDVTLEPTELTELPLMKYVDLTPLPAPGAEDRHRGYVPFAGNILQTVYPTSVPRADGRLTELRLFSFPGEREAATFCVWALEDIAELRLAASPLRTTAGEVIPAANVRVQPVECLIRRGQSRWGPFASRPMLQPVYIEDRSLTHVARNTTRQLWVTVTVPQNTPGGEYAGEITLSTSASSWSFPVRLKVYPFGLPDVPGIALGMYERWRKDDGFMQAALSDMRAHGMTTLGLCCPLGAKIDIVEGKPRVQWTDDTDLVRAMLAYRKAGFPEPVLWLMGGDVLRWSLRQDTFADAYRGVIEAVEAKAKAEGWPEIIYQPVDEPFEHTAKLPAAKRCLEVLKTIPGLRTEEDGPNGNPQTLDELYGLCDVFAYHDGPFVTRAGYDADAWQRLLARTTADGKTIWFYNVDLTGYHPEAMRFGYGFGLWAGQGKGVIEWAYMFRFDPAVAASSSGPGSAKWAYADPHTMYFRYPPTDTRAGGPSIGWEATREGVKDYKLLAFFFRKIDEALASGDPRRAEQARKARATVQQQLSRLRFEEIMATAGKGRWSRYVTGDDGAPCVSGSFKIPNGWTFADYDATRKLIADAIVTLSVKERD